MTQPAVLDGISPRAEWEHKLRQRSLDALRPLYEGGIAGVWNACRELRRVEATLGALIDDDASDDERNHTFARVGGDALVEALGRVGNWIEEALEGIRVGPPASLSATEDYLRDELEDVGLELRDR